MAIRDGEKSSERTSPLDRGMDLDHPGSSKEKQHISSIGPAIEPDVSRESKIANKDHKTALPPKSSSRASTSPSSPPGPPVQGKRNKRKNSPGDQKELSELYEASIPLLSLREWIFPGDKQVSITEGKEKAIENTEKLKLTTSKETVDYTDVMNANDISNIKGKTKAAKNRTGKKEPQTRPKRKENRLTAVPQKNNRVRVSPELLLAEEKMRRSFYEPYDNKIWGWIFGGTVYYMQENHQAWKYEEKSSTSKFAVKLASEISKTINQGNHPGVDTISKSELNQNALNFAELMLSINLRVLWAFDATLIDKEYLAEHNLIQQWLLGILSQQRSQSAGSSSKTISVEIFPELTLEKVVDNFVGVLSSKKSDILVHRLVKLHDSGPIFLGVASESQLKMTKSIVTLLASYYKLMNSAKWSALFKDHGAYLGHISKIQTEHYNCHSQRIATPKSFMVAMKLLPWKDKMEKIDQSTRKALITSMRVSTSSKRDDRVQPFDTGRPAIVGDEVWASISLIEREEWCIIKADFKQLNLAHSRYQPDKNQYLSPALKQYVSHQRNLAGVEYLVRLLWVLNSRMIEVLGYHLRDPEYYEEQDHIQREMFGILNEPTNQEGLLEALKEKAQTKAKKNQAKPPEETPEPKDDSRSSQEELVANLIFSGLRNKETQRRYETTFRTIERVSRYEIKMTQAVLGMIKYHYKKKNIVKWYNMFKDDAGFMLGFEKLAVRLRNPHTYREFVDVSMPSMRGMQLLPWESTMFSTGAQRLTASFLLRRKQHL
ncbi:uncharacterized protein PGTG_17650 [Puccinia graminis f. sp. tritici CRL 75-36-700-3]|uniref:Uncharacterized protein n=1 Tax=Puccinia graminis f. sp. tritici (strain CRL 75-36-700-3 / race SCCL) TaxID=418459 RepID=E3L4X1_PUCGT|nr:uncharacterized protein PGTG_17650 [Puccinia graminis f. sp. tritici CRL 75-36-700-3]EFP91596.2 hypothetical protein PGTG_17650 [Puccinia graminis f. sp. tritici CRL 75-36-700-3]